MGVESSRDPGGSHDLGGVYERAGTVGSGAPDDRRALGIGGDGLRGSSELAEIQRSPGVLGEDGVDVGGGLARQGADVDLQLDFQPQGVSIAEVAVLGTITPAVTIVEKQGAT